MAITEPAAVPEAPSAGPTRLTREELYELVWSEAMRTLAPKFGLSDVGLAKVCKRMRIPRPGLGYWAKKAAGQSVRRTRLPEVLTSAGPDVLEVVVNRSVHHDESEDGSTIEVAEPAGPVPDQERFEAKPDNRIVAGDVLTEPHRLVAQTVKALRRAKPRPDGFLPRTAQCLNVQASLDGADRAMCILDALLKAAEARGWAVSITPPPNEHYPSATVIRVRGEEVKIALSERLETVERPDPKDRRRPAGGRALLVWEALHGPALPPIRERVATGQFTLRIDEFVKGLRVSWSDGKKQRVDQSLNAFMVALVVVGERLRLRRLEHEERQRQWRAEQERQAQEAARREAEAGRVRALARAIDGWEYAQRIREYIAAARAALTRSEAGDADPAVVAWLEWAEQYAVRIDPVLPLPVVPPDPGLPRREPLW